MHLPPAALPGGLLLLSDPAAQAIAAQVFGRRAAPYRVPATFVEPFIAPALTNGWANAGGANNVAGYVKDASGIVRLRGLVSGGTIGLAIFTLPVGFRPVGAENIATASNNAFGYLTISTAGAVVPAVGNNTWFSLDNITFRAA